MKSITKAICQHEVKRNKWIKSLCKLCRNEKRCKDKEKYIEQFSKKKTSI